MSDVFALLDGVAARVSALLIPEELDALIDFLRGESWEEVPLQQEQKQELTAPDGDKSADVSIRIFNTVTGCYNYTPLAIAADVSLVSISSSGDRTAIVQNFERCGFRVFAVNLMSESPDAQKGFQRNKRACGCGNARMSCMEATRLWCDAVYEEAKGYYTSDRGDVNGGGCTDKRMRCEVGDTAATQACAYKCGNLPSGPCTRRALFIIRCCANESVIQGGDVNKSRRSRDPLLLLLHEIGAMAALCRARENTYQVRICFAVLLLPDDLAYGGALLKDVFRERVGRDYFVRLFCGASACVARRDEAEMTAFARRIEMWLNVPVTSHTSGNSGAKELAENKDDMVTSNSEGAELTRWRESGFFLLRRENIPFCCFLRESVRRFPVLLPPVAFQQLQVLWASRRQLGDVVVGFHALLCPFAYSASLHDRISASPMPLLPSLLNAAEAAPTAIPGCSASGAIAASANSCDEGNDNMCQHTDAVDILNALFIAAGQLADGHILNEAVAFAVLYEDVVWRRPARLQRIPGVVAVLRRLWRRRRGEVEMCFHEALAACLPVFAPAALVVGAGAEAGRAVVALPPAMAAAPAANASVAPALLRSALFAVLPPHESLEELRCAVRNVKSNGPGDRWQNSDGRGKNGGHAAHPDRQLLLSDNNFFGVSVPDSVRVLHVLAGQAVAQSSGKQKYVSFDLLRRVCQISDERLLRVLKELELTGFVIVNGRELKACLALDL